jgi:hypothetical protein
MFMSLHSSFTAARAAQNRGVMRLIAFTQNDNAAREKET